MKFTTARMENVETQNGSEKKALCNGSDSHSKTPPTTKKEDSIDKPLTIGTKNGSDRYPKDNDVVTTDNGEKTSLRTRLLSFESQIRLGDFVDAQDSTGKWYEAVVINVTEDTVKVHYAGWSTRWDCTIVRRRTFSDDGRPIHFAQCSKIAGPPQALWSHTMKWREEIQAGHEVEVREAVSSLDRPRWLRAIVRYVGDREDVVRDCTGGAELQLFDVGSDDAFDGESSKQKLPLLLLNRKQQVLVEVLDEQAEFPSISPSDKSSIDTEKLCTSNGQSIAARPPFIRWVYLYGEEICERNTHIRSHLVDDLEITETKKSKIDINEKPAPITPQSNSNNHPSNGITNKESRKGVPPTPGSVGFRNLGNSCYMNSIIQCLNRIEPLTDYFLKGIYIKDINENNPLGSGGRIANSYAALLSDMWSGEYSILAPQELKGTLGNFAPQFNNLHQHDSQEFCSFLMDGIHEDLNRVKVKPYVEDVEGWGMDDHTAALESWKKHLLRHDSVIVDSCQGMHRSHLTCLTCRKESVKFDVYSNLSLSLEPSSDNGKPISLTDCLKQFTMGEQLDDQNAWFCPMCQKNVRALKMMKLWSTPDILILHLKRFTFGTCPKGDFIRSKIEHVVDFPIDTLDMEPYIQGPIDPTAPPSYELFAVSEHSGSTPNSGHYTSTVRNSRDGQWYRYDDSHVSVISGDKAVTGGVYLLFYKRKKGTSRWAGLQNAMNSKVTRDTAQAPVDAEGFTEVTMRRKKRNGHCPKK